MEPRRASVVRVAPIPMVQSYEAHSNMKYSVGEDELLDEDIARILEGNQDWVARMTSVDPEYFIARSLVHKPKYLYIGCSDARAPADVMMGLQPGDLFVHRNIANQVVSTDCNCGSVIEYATNHLKVKHIIVCGHYGCGGIKYALQSDGWGMIDHWMRLIRDVYRIHAHELDEIPEKDQKLRRLVELNVAEQVMNLYKNPHVQHSVKLTGFPKIHGLVLDIATGLLVTIPVDLVTDPLHRYDHVYLFSKPPTVTNPHHVPGVSEHGTPPKPSQQSAESSVAKDGKEDS
eukprot:RCo044755